MGSTSSTDCSQRPCGAGELVEERAVVCNDLTSGKQVSDDSCAGDKPEGKRMLCPAAKPCEATTTMVTTVQPPMATTSTLGPPLAESRVSCCPTGYVALKGNALPSTCSSSCEVKKCCSMVNWVYLEWDDTQACHSSCGLPEQKQHRSVTCQAISTGEVVSDDLCLGVLPARERSLCPATPACGDCSGVLCGKDALPVAPAPSCAGDTCTSKRCCRTFASGFAAEQLPLAVTAVANEGSQGGMLYFKGTAPKLAEQGFAFRLSGGTGMELAQGAAKFTAGGPSGDNAVAFTELALYGNQKALQGRVLDEESKEVTGCALADGSGAGTGCEMHAAALGGLWEYRFAACSAPSSLVVAAQAGSFSLNVSYSTPTGDWKLCAQTIGAKDSLSTSLGCVPAAKPWWQH
ncbi:unnamed protein product [Effrenium voratum]|nr:unnamed protein product [Effrenium voratum]